MFLLITVNKVCHLLLSDNFVRFIFLSTGSYTWLSKSKFHLATSKLAGNTSLTENELDLLEDRSGIASRQREDIQQENQVVVNGRRSSRTLEHVYVWNCGRCFYTSKIATMVSVLSELSSVKSMIERFSNPSRGFKNKIA